MSWELLKIILETEICPILEQVQVRPTKIVIHERIAEKVLDRELSECFHWLDSTMRDAILDYKRVRRLLPDEMWEYYTLNELTDLREMKLLAEASAKLRHVWTKRPKLLTSRYTYAKPRREPSEAESEDQETVSAEDEAAAEL